MNFLHRQSQLLEFVSPHPMPEEEVASMMIEELSSPQEQSRAK